MTSLFPSNCHFCSHSKGQNALFCFVTKLFTCVVLFSDLRRYRSSAKHYRHPLPKVVSSSFSMKMVLNCVHIWSVDLFLVKDNAPVRNLVKSIF